MDVREYYKMNKILLMCIGQWPFQSRRCSRAIVALAVFLLFALLVTVISAMIKFSDENGVVFESIRMLLLITFCVTKFTTSAINSKKIMKLLIRIRDDWEIWALDEEVAILHAYANVGRKFMMTYMVTLQMVLLVVVSQVTVPKIVDSLFFNGTVPGEFLYPAYYFGLDMEKYFFFCVAHMAFSFAVIIVIGAALDALFFVNVQHACGIFAAIGHKLQRLGQNEDLMAGSQVEIETLATCIVRHDRGIEFAKLIESTWSINSSVSVVINMVGMSLTGIQILMTQDNVRSAIKFGLFFNVELVHLFMECYIPQILMDHSTSLRDYIQDGKWYNMSCKSQKLLNLIIMRCNRPCKVRIGKICDLSLETFVAICKKSGSYFMVLRSFRQ